MCVKNPPISFTYRVFQLVAMKKMFSISNRGVTTFSSKILFVVMRTIENSLQKTKTVCLHFWKWSKIKLVSKNLFVALKIICVLWRHLDSCMLSQIFFCQKSKQENEKPKEKESEFLYLEVSGRTLGSKTSPGLNFNCNFLCWVFVSLRRNKINKNKIKIWITN